MVGIHWEGSSTPPIGYSEYNLDCSKNWTDTGSGWVFNGNTGGFSCSWPMMQVTLEQTIDGDCEDTGF